MKLFYRQQGQGHPLLILHGLLGSSDNWFSLGKVFAKKFSVYLIDQRNHGLSPHSDEFNYQLLTEDLEEFIRDHKIEKPHLIGHSMGGKTVMNFAVKNPTLVDQLIVVDIVPKKYPPHHEKQIQGLRAIPIDTITSRAAADELLATYEPDPVVRQFLLKNLSRNDNGKFSWKANLPALENHSKEIWEDLLYTGTFNNPTLFIKGKKSNYFADGDEILIRKTFPKSKFVVFNTGHWVQAEKPQEFEQIALDFLHG